MKKGVAKEVKLILKEQPRLVFEFNHQGQTALHLAAMRNHSDVARVLLEYPILVDKPDLLGRNALFFAAKFNHLQSVKLLLLHKAKPGIRNNQGLNCFNVCTDDKIRSFL